MELAQIPELDLVSSSCEALESEQMKIGSQRILVSDHINAYQYSSEKVDSFVIDMDSFSSTINKDIINANSRTTLQRSLSRKGSQRGGDRNVSGNVTLQDKDIVPTTCSPKGTISLPKCYRPRSLFSSNFKFVSFHLLGLGSSLFLVFDVTHGNF